MKPELLLPAGGFDAGVAAFEGGADAIYLGLSAFSARKQARNFSDLEYRRILALARSTGKKVYVALNTLVLDAEIPALCERLAFLLRFTPDAIIFQDWGIAALVRERFPALKLHASTQTAIQGLDGARLAAGLGVERIVLPRETSALELAELKEGLPAMDFEVFVHGALCYSFSGLCLASGLLLGRSGNRGDCAQLCRSWYKGEGPGLKGQGYWFSCKDLSLVGRLAEFTAAGVTSFKIEGRMKSPEYVHAVASLYRGALDRLSGEGPDEDELSRRLEATRIAFARSPSAGFAGHHGGSDLIDREFPGHRGLPLGVVVERDAGSFVIELAGSLGLRDGLQVLGHVTEGRVSETLRFSAMDLSEAPSGRRLLRARAGSRVRLALPDTSHPGAGLLEPGAAVWRISARELDRRVPSPEEFPPAVSRLEARLFVDRVEEAGVLLGIDVKPLAADGTASATPSFTFVDESVLPAERARQAGGFMKALALFAESGDHDFKLDVDIAGDRSVDFDEGARSETQGHPHPFDVADLFVPPSAFKAFKNRIYAACATEMATYDRGQAESAATWAATPPASRASEEPPAFDLIPPRAALSFPHPQLPGGMPFATPSLLDSGAALPEAGGRLWLPMAALVADLDDYLDLVEGRVRRELGAGRKIMVGLDAFHHLAFSRRLRENVASIHAGDRLGFYIDYHLYVANLVTLSLLARLVPGLLFAYSWLEDAQGSGDSSTAGAAASKGLPILSEVGPGFSPPLFLSKGCLLRHHAGGGRCPVPCSRRMASVVKDRDRRYLALVEDCVSMLFALPSA